MATLTSLPPELLLDIFSYNAADLSAGHIAITVGCVCKSFHHVVQSIDLFYVPLRSIGGMQNFLGVLRRRADARKRVRSLLIAACSDSSKEDMTSGIDPTALVEEIISNINPSCLHTLFIYFPSSNHNVPTLHFPTSLPALTTLHLSGLIATVPSSIRDPFPHLKNVRLLRISELSEDHRNIPQILHALAPDLTQLQLSLQGATSAFTSRLVTQVGDFLNANLNSRPLSLLNHAFPDSLKQIVLDSNLPFRGEGFSPALPLLFATLRLMAAHQKIVQDQESVVLVPFPQVEGEDREKEELVEEWTRVNVGEDVERPDRSHRTDPALPV
ncbi:hypothetical protein EIP91_001717 [Steccherinum ochraceum]|uniref:F-box domain-containing protein n=1 Tax=Steccherinum ochraceum TaxID=92696 RepID=A0A4R0RH94_9APHY|nr:hypothetical protein EIP91_001717 [Steccherinum ochraceum]